MAIQMRRGNIADYDASMMRPGEIAVATDTEQVFVGMANGAVEIAKKSDVDSASETILDAKVKALESIYGGEPSTVATAAEMTNTDLTYIYSGSETGYTAGHWYYWNGTAWTDGGQYASGMILDEISEGILESYVTEGSYTSAGVTTERISDTELKVYGTCTGNRRFNVYNGFQTVRTTTSPFQEMLPAGTYRVSMSANKTTGNPRVTFSYSTYADALWTILNGQTVIYEFTQPFMFGFYANTNINYGTAEDPTIVTLRIESITAKDEVARETKADQDGTYPDLTAGQLYSENGVENTEPYFFRAVPAAASEARLGKLVGGTVAWNQLCNGSSVTVASGHKYYLSKGGTKSIGSSAGAAITGLTSGTDMVIDLTLALGSTIADYIYSLETATAGAGVAFFRKYFPEDYYAYNAGELKSVEGVSEKVTTGKNLFDPVLYVGCAYNPTIGATFSTELHGTQFAVNSDRSEFSISTTQTWRYYCLLFPLIDSEKYRRTLSFYSGLGTGQIGFTEGYLDSEYKVLTKFNNTSANIVLDYTFAIPDGAKYYYIVLTNRGTAVQTLVLKNPQIEFGTTATAYEPYVSHTYPLDSDLTLRGIPKLADGKIYFDGDEYKADGTVMRKYGTRAYQSGDVTGDTMITDGTNTVYKLSTTTTETADPFTESEIIDPYGTEEFVSTGIVPVGHDTLYVDDLKQRLEDIAPPTTDGTYTLQVTVSGGKPTFAWVAASRSLSMGNPFASAAEEEPVEETAEEETEEPVEEGDMR